VKTRDALRYSDHYAEQGNALFSVAQSKNLEGIVAKKRASLYEERRSREWLKIKIRKQVECVVGGYTVPEGSRTHFGSLGYRDGFSRYNTVTRTVRPGQVLEGMPDAPHKKNYRLQYHCEFLQCEQIHRPVHFLLGRLEWVQKMTQGSTAKSDGHARRVVMTVLLALALSVVATFVATELYLVWLKPRPSTADAIGIGAEMALAPIRYAPIPIAVGLFSHAALVLVRRSIAVAISCMAAAVGGAVMAYLMAYRSAGIAWRQALVSMTCSWCCVSLIFFVAVYRRRASA
jgi:hypothetical protein